MIRIYRIITCFAMTLLFIACAPPVEVPQYRKNPSVLSQSTNDHIPLNEEIVISTLRETQAEILFWSGKVAGYDVRWLSDDLVLSDGNTRISWRGNVQREFKTLQRDNSGLHCSYDRGLKVLSIVGDFVSIYESRSIICGVPSHFQDVLTLDLKEPFHWPDDDAGRRDGVRLTDLFPEQNIFQALARHEIVRGCLGGSSEPDLRAMLQAIEEQCNGKSFGYYGLSADLDHFAFLEVRDEVIIVRVYLFPTSGVNDTRMANIDIVLPIPAKLSQDLVVERTKAQGFTIARTEGPGQSSNSYFQGNF